MAKLTKVYCVIELADGRCFDLRITNRARIASEVWGNKARVGSPEDTSMQRVSYAIFEQCKLDGIVPDDTKWSDFKNDQLVDFDQREDEIEVDPTPLAQDESSRSASPPRPASTPHGSTRPTTTN